MNQLRYVLLVVTVVALVGVSALALTVPNTFVSGEVISAAEMNANFSAVEAAVAALQASQPRVAHTKVVGSVSVDDTTMVDIVVVTIDAPAAGVVIVEYTAQAAFGGKTGINGMAFQIDTDAGGAVIGEEYFFVAYDTPPSSSYVYLPVAIQRAFEVGAGAHTFRAEASRYGDSTGDRYMWNPRITATWYPAGSVDLSATIGTSSAGGGNQR